MREIGLVTAYFLTCFLFFLTLKKLLLAEYRIASDVIGTAVVGALVIAKVVILLEKTSFGNWLRDSHVLGHVVVRSLTYTGVVFLVTLAEHLFDAYRTTGALPAPATLASEQNLDHFLAMNLAVGFSFLVYNSLSEIDRHLGEGGLRRLFFGPPPGTR